MPKVTLKECYVALGLQQGVDMTEIKHAYRKLAFAFHPDLNPNVPDAARRFQIINEAYVQLSQMEQGASKSKGAYSRPGQSTQDTARAREEAKRAYSKARQEHTKTSATTGKERPKEDVLKDILNDPFARRVFEDIYSHVKKDEHQAQDTSSSRSGSAQSSTKTTSRTSPRPGTLRNTQKLAQAPGVIGKMKGWLRKQIDDQQVIRLPAASLVPKARVRLEIQHGLSEKPQVIEIVLPPEFVPGKPMRLKGMGRRVGNWRGDLYVIIEPY